MLSPGAHVVCLKTGRPGVVTAHVEPGRGKRCWYVRWVGGWDFTLLSSDDVRIATEMDARDLERNHSPEP